MKEHILDEAHISMYFVHHEGDKMYQNLKLMFWWSGMKNDIVEFVS